MFEKSIQENSVKEPCVLKENESEVKLNSEYFLELATLEINAIRRMQYFFWCCLNTTVSEVNNFNIGRLNLIQNKFF